MIVSVSAPFVRASRQHGRLAPFTARREALIQQGERVIRLWSAPVDDVQRVGRITDEAGIGRVVAEGFTTNPLCCVICACRLVVLKGLSRVWTEDDVQEPPAVAGQRRAAMIVDAVTHVYRITPLIRRMVISRDHRARDRVEPGDVCPVADAHDFVGAGVARGACRSRRCLSIFVRS